MAIVTTPETYFSADADQDGHQDGHLNGIQERVEDRFQLIDVAGMGFFGVVFFALPKYDHMMNQSLLKSNPSNYNIASSIQLIQAVKICNPLCPSGIKASAEYLLKDITAMKTIWSGMEKTVRHNFVRLLNYNTSGTPWYSMEPVISGLTMEKLYSASKVQRVPVPEELAFHIVGQISQACLFLYEKCGIVRADTNRENIMLRYPGREIALLPDVVLVDWSLWEDASAENISRDTKDIYECLHPVLFQGGWKCGMNHDRHKCSMSNIAVHSPQWLDLFQIMSNKQLPLNDLEKKNAEVVNESRQRIELNDQVAGKIKELLSEASSTETKLKEALFSHRSVVVTL